MKKLVKNIIGEISLNVLIVSVLFVIALFVFGFLAHEVVSENEAAFDQKVFAFFKAHTTKGLIVVMSFLTFFGSSYFFLPAYILLLVFLFVKHKRTEAINIGVIAITSTLLMFGLKEYFHRQRPTLPLLKTLTNFSFPSGHALSSFIFSSVIIYLIWRGNLSKTLKWLFSGLLILFSITIGISRIVLRYHFASDVLAGFCLGLAWVIFSLWLERKLTPKQLEEQLDV
jgi:membrane-associated phospholipid phosphatase